jgi:hypothetical protein
MDFGSALAKLDMKAAPRLKLKAQLTVLLVAGCMTEMCELVISIAAGLTVGDMSPTAFVVPGGGNGVAGAPMDSGGRAQGVR